MAPTTRARAAAFRQSGEVLPPACPKQQGKKRDLLNECKRSAMDDWGLNALNVANSQNKRREVLKDVTNICCNNSYSNCLNQMKKRRQLRDGKAKSKLCERPHPIELKFRCIPADSHASVDMERQQKVQLEEKQSESSRELRRFSEKDTSIKLGFMDIDFDSKDPQLCSIYAPEIYSYFRVRELVRRPSVNFLGTVQKDITERMRGILVDWLVEVCEEYKLVPDTLYLTVHLVDIYLSENYVERQKLQLLGITCMLIASKYEEICPPRVEEFCFITDNAYNKDEVIAMESQILNFLQFQLSVPTAKTFLRRFLRAAQACYENPSIELEFLADYLAELTLIDYSFLKFLPSAIAASAIFLARWTLDQSDRPWNSTLEHYARYNASELRLPVLALRCLQLNTNGCPLTAIRSKYKREKFKSVAALASPELVDTLFEA